MYHGISHPIRDFSRTMSACGAREAYASVVSRAFEMGEVGNLIGPKGAAAAGMFGPAEHPGFEEGTVHDQLAPAFEQVEQTRLPGRSIERVRPLHGHPRHQPPFGGQRVTSPRVGLLFCE